MQYEQMLGANSQAIKFFKDAAGMGIESRLKYFHDVFPFAEALPINFYLVDSRGITLVSNQTTLNEFDEINGVNYWDVPVYTYFERKKWPEKYGAAAHLNNKLALAGTANSFIENSMSGNFTKKWASKKVAVCDERQQPIGIVGYSVVTGLEIDKLSYDSRSKKVTINFSEDKAIIISAREFTILRDYLCGYSAAEIADKQCVSPKTIETYFANIKHKFNCQKQRQLLSYLINNDLAREIVMMDIPG